MSRYETPTLNAARLQAYARRIGHVGPLLADLATLDALHRRQPEALPFENLDSFLGRPVNIDLDSVFAKLVEAGRGGYCFEHNGLLAAVLTTLGFEVTGYPARVLWDLGPEVHVPLTHMVLHVRCAEGEYLTDVGFGRLSLTAPLLLEAGEQQTPHERYRLIRESDGWTLAAHIGGQWRSLYRYGLTPAQLCDYAQMNWFVSTHPDSRFVRNLIAARVDGERRHTLLNNRLTTRLGDERVEQRVFSGGVELRECLERQFALRVPQNLLVDQRLESLCHSD
ncbi:MAG: arylamine N-acetyltransferase [Steroidobacteraceae bacterium]